MFSNLVMMGNVDWVVLNKSPIAAQTRSNALGVIAGGFQLIKFSEVESNTHIGFVIVLLHLASWQQFLTALPVYTWLVR